MALTPFVVSRVAIFGIALILDAIGLPWERSTFVSGPFLGVLTGHDAVYYLGIASEGYHLGPVSGAYTDWVFFPAFPILARLVSVLTLGDVAVAGVIASNAATYVGMILVGRLMAEHGDGKAVRPALWLLVFAPGAVAFGMAYSDSLLVAASAGALLSARHRVTWLTAMLFAVATLSRPPGILLGLPLAVAILAADHRRLAPRILALAAGPLALAAFAVYQGVVLGDPLAFIRGQAAWTIPRLIEPSTGGASATGDAWYLLPIGGLLLAVLLAYTATLPGLWRSRLPRSVVVLALMAFLSVFISGRLQSDARYLAGGWPFAWFLGTRSRRTRRLAFTLSLTGFLLFAVLNLTQLLAP
jgi:hypothetical protein